MLFAVLLLAVVSARAEGFRFALMSDLHVTADSLAANDLRHAVDQINATPGLSFVIVSGDFTDYGDDASLRKAKAILDGLKLKYYVTSGNHETKWSESGATSGRASRFFQQNFLRKKWNSSMTSSPRRRRGGIVIFNTSRR